jgi:hypothetical protein
MTSNSGSSTNLQSGSATACFTANYSANTSTQTTGISVTIDNAGTSGTNANLPPYYALAYIMKT